VSAFIALCHEARGAGDHLAIALGGADGGHDAGAAQHDGGEIVICLLHGYAAELPA